MRWFLWFIRRKFKRWAARHFLIAEYCHRCGCQQPMAWCAPDDLWQSVDVGDYYDVLCPKCFDLIAWSQRRGVYWWAAEDDQMLAKHRAKKEAAG